jgi:hypothetical protein
MGLLGLQQWLSTIVPPWMALFLKFTGKLRTFLSCHFQIETMEQSCLEKYRVHRVEFGRLQLLIAVRV